MRIIGLAAPFVLLLLLFPLISFAFAGCPAEREPMCGYKEECTLGTCVYYSTYENVCLMHASGAELMHAGECEGAQKEAGAVQTRLFSDIYPLLPEFPKEYDFLAVISAITTRLLAWAYL